MFVQLRAEELLLVKEIVKVFSEASNFRKSCHSYQMWGSRFGGCTAGTFLMWSFFLVNTFECRWQWKLAKRNLYPLIDKIDRLPGWKAAIIILLEERH